VHHKQAKATPQSGKREKRQPAVQGTNGASMFVFEERSKQVCS
jgi:hypothetical protein